MTTITHNPLIPSVKLNSKENDQILQKNSRRGGPNMNKINLLASPPTRSSLKNSDNADWVFFYSFQKCVI